MCFYWITEKPRCNNINEIKQPLQGIRSACSFWDKQSQRSWSHTVVAGREGWHVEMWSRTGLTFWWNYLTHTSHSLLCKFTKEFKFKQDKINKDCILLFFHTLDIYRKVVRLVCWVLKLCPACISVFSPDINRDLREKFEFRLETSITLHLCLSQCNP